MIIALARPQRGTEVVRQSTKGIAIEMVLDRSGSMQAPMRYGQTEMSRLDAVKNVFAEFVQGGTGGLAGRNNDLIGLIAFARRAVTVCPLTLAHDVFPKLLRTIGPPRKKSEDGTGIGDALALAAARLRTAEDTLARQTGGNSYEIKSKAIILLTDGQNNAGKRSPLAAAALAKKWGIKIYAIGIGSDRRELLRNPMSMLLGPLDEGVDKELLQAVAETSGGIFRMANDAEALRRIYAEIDALEKSEFESVRSVDYRELFPPWALAALMLLVIESAASAVLLRRHP